MAAEMDYNIANYTLAELLSICNIQSLTREDILENTTPYIKKYKTKNPSLSVFFENAQSELLNYIQSDTVTTSLPSSALASSSFSSSHPTLMMPHTKPSTTRQYAPAEKQVRDWYTNETLTQKSATQTDKITDRKQKIQLFGNEHVPMNREQIATTDTYALPVKQDSLNPNLKNTINRFLNLNSLFRQYTSGPDSLSTNYTCDLSDTLKNVLSLSVYSYQIPFSWYAIDSVYGNTCFWISSGSAGTSGTGSGSSSSSGVSDTNPSPPILFVAVSIPPGNYTSSQFVDQMTRSLAAAGFVFPDAATTPPVAYSVTSAKLTFALLGSEWTDPDNAAAGVQFTITTASELIFYDFTGELACGTTCTPSLGHYFNNTLGWIMGFRTPFVAVDARVVAPCVLDLNGTKYLILVIDDYNQNHVNNSLVSISQLSNTLKMPSYYSPDLPTVCLAPPATSNMSSLLSSAGATGNTDNGLLLAGKYERDYTPTAVVVPSAPRTLTNAQLYTINAINANNNNLTNYLTRAPTSSDILAILPIKTSTSVPTGSMLVDFSGSLQNSTRTYFGPVNIDRMAVKLLDDKGNVVNLNGCDWCVTLVAQCLYQY